MNLGVYFDTKYVIDTTPAATLRDEWCKTKFFEDSCFFPDEIMYELKGNMVISQQIIVKQKIPVSLGVLDKLQTSVTHKIGKVVDLYSYNGNGDALILATVLNEQGKDLGEMIKTRWIIATEDKDLAAKAKEYNIECIDKKTLYNLLQDAYKNEGVRDNATEGSRL
jgi:hypothetical protein